MELNKKKGTTKYCVFGDCKTDSRKVDTVFYKFPKGCLNVRKQIVKLSKNHIKQCDSCKKCDRWIQRCKRDDGRFNNVLQVDKHKYICSLHFVHENGPSEMYPDPLPASVVENILKSARNRKRRSSSPIFEINRKQKKQESCNSVPVESLIYVDDSNSPKPDFSVHHNATDEDAVEISERSDESSTSKMIQCDMIMKENSYTQTTFIWHDQLKLKEEITTLKKEKNELENEIKTLKNKSKGKNNNLFANFVESLKSNDKKCTFYTGLIFPKIMVLFTFLSPMDNLNYWGTGKSKKKLENRKKLTALEELILTLIRLRSGLLVTDLRYRFYLSEGLICKVVTTIIQHMYVKFNLMRPFMFPSREKINENLPSNFKRLKNIRVIIDCAEFFCQTPANFEQQGNLYSSYKSHTTFKVLLGCTPNGAVSFVSELFEGSISDKELVRKSKLIDLLDEGDLVLADRGFTIKDLTVKKRVSLNIPPFLKGRNKLTPEEEIETKNIAKERIYIEHVVGRLKQFRLLQKNLPLSMRGILSNIVFVCACLLNFQEPILKKSTN